MYLPQPLYHSVLTFLFELKILFVYSMVFGVTVLRLNTSIIIIITKVSLTHKKRNCTIWHFYFLPSVNILPSILLSFLFKKMSTSLLHSTCKWYWPVDLDYSLMSLLIDGNKVSPFFSLQKINLSLRGYLKIHFGRIILLAYSNLK